MSDPVQISRHVEADAEAKWLAYVDAKKLADKTLRIEHGIAAGRAWRDFLSAFDRSHGSADVVPFPTRARQ